MSSTIQSYTHEDPATPWPGSIVAATSRGPERGQAHPERRPPSRHRLDRDRTAMLLDDRVRDREAETAAGDRPLLGERGAEEPAEEPILLLGRDPDTGVGDLDRDPLLADAHPDVDPAVLGRELH